MFEAEDNEDRCLEDVKQKRLNEDVAYNLITEKLKGKSIPYLQHMPQMERREVIK
jgi:hypothetical protein